jgi:hypothetical protein
MNFYFESLWNEGEGIVILGIVINYKKIGVCIFNYSFGLETN